MKNNGLIKILQKWLMKMLMKQHNSLFDFRPIEKPEKKASEKSSKSSKNEEIDSFL